MQTNTRPFLISLATAVVFALTASPEFANASRYTEFGDYIAEANYPAALEVARKIIKKPNVVLRINKDKDYLINVRIMGLQALGYYAEHIGLEPGMIDEAIGYYNKALEFAGDRVDLQARMHHELAIFYSMAGKSGLAIPLMSKAVDLYESRRDTYNTLATYMSWSRLYSDMGDQTLSNHFEAKWVDTANKYFVLGRRPRDEEKWLVYYEALEGHAHDLAQSSRVSDLNAVWETMTTINDTYMSEKVSHYQSGAKLYAIAGMPEIALEMLDKADQETEVFSAKMLSLASGEEAAILVNALDTDEACTRAQVFNEIGRVDLAMEYGRKCEQLWETTDRDIGTASRIILGQVYEANGDNANAVRLYDLGVKAIEGLRSSFRVQDRAAFFTNPVTQAPYWGLIRVHAKNWNQEQSADKFHKVLQAKERIRARQFGEMSGAAEISSEALAAIQQRLGPDTAVLDYVLTGNEIIFSAFTRDRHTVALIPFERADFRRNLLTLASALADPNSSTDDIAGRIQLLSRTLLSPALSIISGKKQLIVLTDGELNLVPFELWSIDDSQYRPLIDVATVRYVPALRFLAAEQAASGVVGEGLAALGDPVYADASSIAGLPASEIEAATRNSTYLSYFAPLPETRTEVESIAELFSGQSTEIFLGERAVESSIKAAELSRYEYVHFATHGVLGGEVPGIGEPALVLGAEPDEDGFLKASEAEELKLNAKLTALSACNTGSGEYVQGEGVMGLSRAFLLAGSESVLVSLWPVASEATEELMVRFYSYLRDGERPQAALKRAKNDIRSELPHPFFWAPFILISQN